MQIIDLSEMEYIKDLVKLEETLFSKLLCLSRFGQTHLSFGKEDISINVKRIFLSPGEDIKQKPLANIFQGKTFDFAIVKRDYFNRNKNFDYYDVAPCSKEQMKNIYKIQKCIKNKAFI